MALGRVLITGAGGFVAAHLAPRIAERGGVPLGLALDPPASGHAFQGLWVADLREAADLAGILREARPDGIVHLAAMSSAGRSFREPVETFRVNVLGTQRLLDAVREAAPQARVLVVGTGEAYGPQPEGTRVDERARFQPVSPYALSKAAADALAEVYAQSYGMAIVRVRPFGHTGPGQRPDFVLPSFAQQIAAIEAGRGEPLLAVGNLDVVRDLCDVRDVVDGYIALLERGVAGEVYNLCRGSGVKLTDVTRMLVERASRPVEIRVDPARVRPADVPYLVGDPTRIASAVGWKATTPLETTLDDVLAEWRGRERGQR